MIYSFLRHLMRIAYKVYFRKIYFSNTHRIPKKEPIVMPMNHPTAFTEPAAMGALANRPVHFILKGNVFSTPLIRWFLEAIKTIPIFRLRDGGGFASLRQNAETMDIVNNKLADNQIILILAEGVRKDEKRLRPIQKGAARMVFKFYETTKREDLAILNTGVNYTNATQFRSDMMIDFAEPLWLRDYVELYKEHDRKALNKLTKDIKKGLQERVIHIENEVDDKLVNFVLDMNRNGRKTATFPILEDNSQPLQEEMKIAQSINEMEELQKNNLREKVASYHALLKKKSVEDQGVAKPQSSTFVNLLLLLLGAIPAIIGFILNALPIKMADNMAHKKADCSESLASLRPALGMFFYSIYFLLVFIVVAIFGTKWWFIGLIVMPFLGYFYIIWTELGRKWVQSRTFLKLNKTEREKILSRRKEILDFV